MRSERLFRILGLIDEDLIEEVPTSFSAPPKRRRVWLRYGAAAACLAMVCMAAIPFLSDGSKGGSTDGATMESGSGIVSDTEPLSAEGTTFMSYAGPVFPLTLTEEIEGVTAERTTTWDFTTGAYSSGEPRQWGAEVTDRYILTNSTTGDILATVCYPYAGSLNDVHTQIPTMTVDGAETDASLHAGAYAGGFTHAGVDDGSTWNLDPPDSWTDYKTLLADGSYLAKVLDKIPDITTPVTVYYFTDIKAPANYNAATQAIEFTIDTAKTTILTCGFNGLSWNEETGWRRYDYFARSVHHSNTLPTLIVLGEDITDYTLQGYQDGGCEASEELEGVTCTLTREETTLGAALDALCREYAAKFDDDGENPFTMVSIDMFTDTVKQLIQQHGMLAGDNLKDRYADGRLDEVLSESLTQGRVLYLTAEVTIPAGESVDITFNFSKEPSFDFGCCDEDHSDLQGYDYVTTLGSNLAFTLQKASLTNTENIEIAGQNFGFDLAAGVTEAALDPNQEHYYLEIRPIV